MASDDNDSSSEDEWGMEELDFSKAQKVSTDGDNRNHQNGDGAEDYWKVEPTKDTERGEDKGKHTATEQEKDDAGSPMIIVDVTNIDPDIHSKHDRNSVNDTEGASAMKRKFETSYDSYATDANMLAEGTVIPCGSSVWRAALVRLRDERPGHYFVPVFPPKKK